MKSKLEWTEINETMFVLRLKEERENMKTKIYEETHKNLFKERNVEARQRRSRM